MNIRISIDSAASRFKAKSIPDKKDAKSYTGTFGRIDSLDRITVGKVPELPQALLAILLDQASEHLGKANARWTRLKPRLRIYFSPHGINTYLR